MPRQDTSSQAKNKPVEIRQALVDTADLGNPDVPDADMDDRGETIIPVDAGKVTAADMRDIAFMEDPLDIIINADNTENPARTKECWVNGQGAEIWDFTQGRWYSTGAIPVEGVVRTKRKYVEVLLRARAEKIVTTQQPNLEERVDGYVLKRSVVGGSNVQVLRDPAGARGVAWLAAVRAER